MKGRPGFERRACPCCGPQVPAGEPWENERLPEAGWQSLSFASRKVREPYHWRYLQCSVCELIYASEVPGSSDIQAHYVDAPFENTSAHQDAASDYARLILDLTEGLPPEGVLDLGAGDGSFLMELKRHHATDLTGIEGSSRAIQHANAEVRTMIRQLFLDPHHDQFRTFVSENRGKYSLITCFQLLEHVLDPLALLHSVRELLRPGGKLVIVSHDVQGWAQKVMGRHSPLLDVEHLQLLSRASLKAMLLRSGFSQVTTAGFSNSHSIGHWLRLSPLPLEMRSLLMKFVEGLKFSEFRIRAPGVNLMAIAESGDR